MEQRHNFKYHSIEDLERLAMQLNAELKLWGAAKELEMDLMDLAMDHYSDERVKQDKEMLKQVEDEILERTLLGADS